MRWPVGGARERQSYSATATRRQDPLTLHHFKAGVEFVAALRAPHAVALDRGFINGNGHPAAVRTAPQLRGLNIERLKLRAAEAIHVLSVKLPGLPGVVDDGQGDVMVRGVVLQFLPGRESALDQLAGLRIIQSVPLHHNFGRSKLHGAPPRPGLSMNTYCDDRSSRGVAHCSSGCNGPWAFLLNVPMTRCNWGSNGCPVRLRRPHLREAPAAFGLGRLATAFMNNPGHH